MAEHVQVCVCRMCIEGRGAVFICHQAATSLLMCVCVRVHARVCMYVFACMYVCVCVCMRVCECMCMYVFTCMYVCVCVYARV